jgi:hypothetical protein
VWVSYPTLEQVTEVDISTHPVLTVMAIAVAASLLAEIRYGTVRVPVVVWETMLGLVLGPQVLVFVRPDRSLEWLGGGSQRDDVTLMAIRVQEDAN